ncbi:hypothetical protein FSP39_004457 [Pinctada imbricata]|uniref:PH domain-containing protein n=1 Tax=Pinctada imbricata TaxID=66713 RepID=A0AA89BLI1_PINIB|nr:hypothetical protein FSP39_004457 [Pinctada imbricata]
MDNTLSTLDPDSSFEELALTSFQELEKVNEEKISASDLQKLLERTRQRREVLDSKLKAPEVTPRKRILEQNNQKTNVPERQENKGKDDGSPGKRQCLRDEENLIKPDTPAIPSVKSRLRNLSHQREDWSANDGVDVNSAPVQSLPPTSPVKSRQIEDVKENVGVAHSTANNTSRRGRLANLAQTINTWEDDLSHPVIKKPEEKKPRWQPPKKEDICIEGPPKPPRMEETKDKPIVVSPVKAHTPGKAHAPPPPPAPSSPSVTKHVVPSPKKITETLPPVWSPSRNGAPQTSTSVAHNHVSGKGQVEMVSSSQQEPVSKPVADIMTAWKKGDASDNAKVKDPTEDTLEARLASWEQKSSGTPARARVSKVQQPVKEMATPISDRPPLPKTPASSARSGPAEDPDMSVSDPAAQPVASRMATWQQRVSQSTPAKEEEPTAYSVTARMSAWEEMSSSNKVSYIKKVDPGSAGSASNPSPKKPVGRSPVKAIGQGNLAPSKSVKDNIMERAAHIQTAMATGRNESVSTPAKAAACTPGKVGSATKMMQQKLLQQTQHSKTDDMADKMRKDRMAELQTIQKRYHNGILREDRVEDSKPEECTEVVQAPCVDNNKEAIKAKAKADFERKLADMGFDLSDEQSGAKYSFNQQKEGTPAAKANLPPKSPGPVNKNVPSGQAQKPPSGSLYRLISQKRNETDKPATQKIGGAKISTSSCSSNEGRSKNKPSIDDSFDSIEDDELFPRHQLPSTEEEMESESNVDTQEEESDQSESCIESEADSRHMDKVSKHTDTVPTCQPYQPPLHVLEESDDDISLYAFVPESVRRRSVMPNPPKNAEEGTTDNGADVQRQTEHTKPYHSNSKLVGYESSSGPSHTSASSLESATSSQSSLAERQQRHLGSNVTLNSTEEEDEVGDFLDEAYSDQDMDTTDQEDQRPKAAPRKRRSHMMATSGEDPRGLVYSVSAYRSRRYLHDAPQTKARIVRKREFDEGVREEHVEMPTQLPPELERKTIKERIQELHELVQQEQSVIVQTSNALNQCCTGNSYFHGSPEQVECNRVLLLACQKRQAYMTEIQRLKDTGHLDPPGSGPKGSLTISDIRLPLKKEFVTKIGTTNDNTVHYFLILIRNYAQVIVTQMLSTHDPMMRGSLDFPNLIKIHGIQGSFKLSMEIYSMSVSRENTGKEKKRKTPKKPSHKGHPTITPSPGGPNAVRTTNFTLITSLPITMKLLDKSCFTLERIPYLSPLHGTIYMRLKCLMEQNVEERGFLTMFEDVSGLGAWHRRWNVLAGNKLCFWKYPDDETKKEPMGYIDLKRCVTEKVGLIPRDICARPNTFEMVTVRQPRRGEPDTLVSKTYNTMTTVRHMLSADTKEERINWCNKINRALANIRTWHSDAMRPIKLPAKEN